MSGSALMMVSPSSSRTMRSTPCVDGCCGPMLSVMRRGAEGDAGVSCVASMVAVCSSKRCCLLILFCRVTVLVPVHRIIFAQRIPFPIDRHQDAHQVRMIAELHAEHVVDFALVPIRRAPHAVHRIDL